MAETILSQTEDFDTLGGRISRAREATGLALSDCAVKVGVDEATLTGWETDSLEPRANRLRILAGVLGVSPTWLLQGVGNAPRGEDENEEIEAMRVQLDAMEQRAGRLMEDMVALRRSLDRLASAQSD